MLLLFGTADQDRIGCQKMRSQRRCSGGAGASHGFNDAAHGQAANAQSAVLFGQIDTHATQLGQRLQAFGTECLGFVVMLGARLDHLASQFFSGFDNGQFDLI
ncbi:hypothetical protein D3C81_1280420 [compost metagenome]